jgi:hypothetical protein
MVSLAASFGEGRLFGEQSTARLSCQRQWTKLVAKRLASPGTAGEVRAQRRTSWAGIGAIRTASFEPNCERLIARWNSVRDS